VRVVVRQAGHARPRHLACFQEVMDDGRTRDRNQLPSEKVT
jgi:hypothetical protein